MGDDFMYLQGKELERRLKSNLARFQEFGKTVIVHPQLSSDPDEAQNLSENWKAREEKQIMDNIFKDW